MSPGLGKPKVLCPMVHVGANVTCPLSMLFMMVYLEYDTVDNLVSVCIEASLNYDGFV